MYSPQKTPPFCLKMSTFSKVLATRENRAISPRKQGIFHYKERNMPPAVLAQPAEQCDGRQMMPNPQKCNILTRIDSNSANIGPFIEPLPKVTVVEMKISFSNFVHGMCGDRLQQFGRLQMRSGLHIKFRKTRHRPFFFFLRYLLTLLGGSTHKTTVNCQGLGQSPKASAILYRKRAIWAACRKVTDGFLEKYFFLLLSSMGHVGIVCSNPWRFKCISLYT